MYASNSCTHSRTPIEITAYLSLDKECCKLHDLYPLVSGDHVMTSLQPLELLRLDLIRQNKQKCMAGQLVSTIAASQ